MRKLALHRVPFFSMLALSMPILRRTLPAISTFCEAASVLLAVWLLLSFIARESMFPAGIHFSRRFLFGHLA